MLTPMHRAVIAGYDNRVAELLKEHADDISTDPLGFTPLELAKLLGCTECQRLLGYHPPAHLRLQKKGEAAPQEISLDTFEQFFSITYRPFLTFTSYNELRTVIANCPYILRWRWLAKENYQAARLYGSQVNDGLLASVYVKWIDPVMEYGLFADEELTKGTFVGEYAGLVRRLYRRDPEINPYCMQYPTKWWSFNYYVIDGMQEGNILRFANHSDTPNMEPVCLVDRGLLRMVLVTSRLVKKGEQLTFNYGYELGTR